jgi:hypothetical protein
MSHSDFTRASRRALLAAAGLVDAAAVALELAALGGRVISTATERLHCRCPDGLGVELVPVDPARIWGLA